MATSISAMTPERWRQIEEIFHAALEVGPDALDAFVRESSGDDEELRIEVMNLLSQLDDASDFIEAPLIDSTDGGVLSSLLNDGGDDPMIGKVLRHLSHRKRDRPRWNGSGLRGCPRGW